MKKEAKPNWRALEDIASEMGISENDLIYILTHHSPPRGIDHRGREAVPAEFIPKAAGDPAYVVARDRAITATERSKTQDSKRDKQYRQRREQLLRQYERPISLIEDMHSRYLGAANAAGFESSALASYLLLSRAISTLKILHSCLGQGHWYGGSMMRDIDECLDLAHYFFLKTGTDEGRQSVLEWFRQGSWPSHRHCRAAIANSLAAVFTDESSEQRLALLLELYRKKSSWTHPSYASIREVTRYGFEPNPYVSSIDYGPCSDEQKLTELADFFKSSIWSTFQVFGICIGGGMGLAEDDIALLQQYDKMFAAWTDDGVPDEIR